MPAVISVWCQRVVLLLAASMLVFLAETSSAQVQQSEGALPRPEVALRLKSLESELRCLVCQNQTLAESPAGLASDLRREVRTMVEAGKSDAEIKACLRARYGDFVLYKPPVDSKTYLLWFGPFALLLLGGTAAAVVTRRRTSAVPTSDSPSDASQAHARKLLDGDEREQER